MDAPDEMVEAVRDAVFRAQPDWRGTPNLTALDAEHIASAVLSVPALAGVIAERDELAEQLAFLRQGCGNLTRDELVQKITAIGPEAWKRGDWLGRVKAEAAERGDQAVRDELAEVIARAFMSEDEYRAATQRWVDEVCYYRNLAITHGAKPEEMLNTADRALCERGLSDVTDVADERSEVVELWGECDAAAEVFARDAKVREMAEDAVWLAKLARGSSWPGEMADRVQRAADRVVSELGSDADRAAIAALYAARIAYRFRTRIAGAVCPVCSAAVEIGDEAVQWTDDAITHEACAALYPEAGK